MQREPPYAAATHWPRLAELLEQAWELEGPARRAWMDALDGRDAELRTELERLLAEDARDCDFDQRLRERIDAEVNSLVVAAGPGSRDDWLGRRVGPYRLTRLLGSGGHGVVFLGERVEGGFEQTVAIKLVLDSIADPYTRQRFVAERRILARLQHPRIARLYDGGLDAEGRPWFAMEPVEGEPITRACDALQLGLSARIELFTAVCEGVDFAHRQLVAHLDLKPGNMLVRGDGRPMLLDFGIARLLGETGEDGMPPQPLTPEYAAPEQLAGRPAGIASDVYALGAVLFELLTGQRPFADPRGVRTPPVASARFVEGSEDMVARAAARSSTPRQLQRRLRGGLDLVLGRALAADPQQRYGSVTGLIADLRRWRDAYPISLRPGRAHAVRCFVVRHRWGVAAAAVAVLTLASATAAAVYQARLARQQAAVSRAISHFMVDVFADADPSHTPHAALDAKALLDAGATRLRAQPIESPAQRVRLLYTLARSYDGIGAYASAQSAAQQALALALPLYGAHAPEIGRIDLELARQLDNHRRAVAAMPLARQALRLLAPGDHARRAAAQLILADGGYFQRAPGVEATAIAAALREAARLAPPRRARYRGSAEYAQAMLSLEQGRLDQADGWFRRAAADLGRGAGPDASATLSALHMRGFLLLHTGQASAAAQVFDDLLQRRRKVFGALHPVMAGSWETYALALAYSGQLHAAHQAITSMLDVVAHTRTRDVGGGEYWQRAGEVERMRGRLHAAARYLVQAQAAYRAGGADDANSLRVDRYDLELLAAQRGDPLAPAAMRAQLAQWQRQGQYVLLAERTALGDALLDTGHPHQALAYETAQLPTAERPELREAIVLQQAGALFVLGDYARSAALADAAQHFFHGRDAAAEHTAQLLRGWCALRLGQPQRSVEDIAAALAWRQREMGERSVLTALAHLAHAEMLASLGLPAEAVRERQAAHAVLTRQLLPASPQLMAAATRAQPVALATL